MRAILTFHSIDSSGSVISFDAPLFEALISYLKKKCIPICDLDTLLENEENEGVAITFDDGRRSIFQNAFPILRKYDVPSHLFLITVRGSVTLPNRPADSPHCEMLDWHEVEALSQAGVCVENHTHTHPDLRRVSEDQIAEECDQASAVITSRIGRRPKYFAYPFGYHNSMVRNITRDLFTGSFTTNLRMLGPREDPAALPRLDAYYLRANAAIRILDTRVMKFYLMLRKSLRAIRGGY